MQKFFHSIKENKSKKLPFGIKAIGKFGAYVLALKEK